MALSDLFSTWMRGARTSFPASCAHPSTGSTGASGNFRKANCSVRSAAAAAEGTAAGVGPIAVKAPPSLERGDGGVGELQEGDVLGAFGARRGGGNRGGRRTHRAS